jgi:beta-carotene 3-hydroxylase
MNFWFSFALVCLTFAGMEVFSWALHKYVMHGFLWTIHQSHHSHRKGIFEINDIFSGFFGGACVFCIVYGLEKQPELLFVGIGIFVYGFLYFLLHDGFIHQRFPFFRKTNNKYIKALQKAHFAHHKHHQKDGGESFGLLWISKKYFKE